MQRWGKSLTEERLASLAYLDPCVARFEGVGDLPV